MRVIVQSLLGLVIVLLLTVNAQSQNSIIYEGYKPLHKFSVSAGLNNGMNELWSVNMSYMPGSVIGWQLEAGYHGLGVSMNFHARPEVNSSGVSVSYWRNGVFQDIDQSVVGLSYLYRKDRSLYGRLGVGYVTQNTGKIQIDHRDNGLTVLYSVGFYFSR